jgi:hypothetical protein
MRYNENTFSEKIFIIFYLYYTWKKLLILKLFKLRYIIIKMIIIIVLKLDQGQNSYYF